MLNQPKMPINMTDQYIERLVQFFLGISGAFDTIAIDKENGLFNRFRNILHRLLLKACGNVALAADNILHGFWQLGHVALLYVLADFNRIFKAVVVVDIGKHYHCPAARRAHQNVVSLLKHIGRGGQNLQHHAAGPVRNRLVIDKAVEIEIVFAITVAELADVVYLVENNGTDFAYDIRSIHGSHLDFSLDILFLVREEVIGLARATDVVLRKQAVKALLHLVALGNFIKLDVIRHQDDDVIEVCLHVIYITDKV